VGRKENLVRSRKTSYKLFLMEHFNIFDWKDNTSKKLSGKGCKAFSNLYLPK